MAKRQMMLPLRMCNGLFELFTEFVVTDVRYVRCVRYTVSRAGLRNLTFSYGFFQTITGIPYGLNWNNDILLEDAGLRRKSARDWWSQWQWRYRWAMLWSSSKGSSEVPRLYHQECSDWHSHTHTGIHTHACTFLLVHNVMYSVSMLSVCLHSTCICVSACFVLFDFVVRVAFCRVLYLLYLLLLYCCV